jgi:hypothetical protein
MIGDWLALGIPPGGVTPIVPVPEPRRCARACVAAGGRQAESAVWWKVTMASIVPCPGENFRKL